MIGEDPQDVQDRQRRVEQKNSLLLRERERERHERHRQIWTGVIMLALLLAVATTIIILATQALRGR